MEPSMKVLLICVFLIAVAPAAALGQANKMDAGERERILDTERRKTGAQHCESMKSGVETLRSSLNRNSGKWSPAMRASVEKDIVAHEAEAKKCCGNLDQCKRDMDTALGPAAKPARK